MMIESQEIIVDTIKVNIRDTIRKICPQQIFDSGMQFRLVKVIM